jgi:D-galactose 1-dehydrogenase
MAPYRIAVIGVGKIATDEHLPSIAKNPRFTLAGLVSGRGIEQPGVPTFQNSAELYAALPDLDAVAICTPPGPRTALAREALDAGVNVLLEKPPTPTVGELRDLARQADGQGRIIFTTWHSQYNAAVEETRARLAGHAIRRLAITWKEDVRRWHPGQDWIWETSGFGVFDPGINALSILTRIMPAPVFVRSARLLTPSNRAMPIAASIAFTSPALTEPAPGEDAITAEFDWRQRGDQTWDIAADLADGTALRLTGGGTALAVDGVTVVEEPRDEYDRIYARFAALLEAGTSFVDMAPFELVADAFMVGRRAEVEPFVA